MRTILTGVAALALLSAAACGESGNEEATSVAVTQDGSPTSIEPYTATGENTGEQIPPAATDTGAVQTELGAAGMSGSATTTGAAASSSPGM